MKHSYTLATAMLMLAAGQSIQAATMMVDWLVMQSGGSPASFTMLNDSNAAVAHGSLTIINGLAFTGLPANRTFAAANWTSQPDVSDSASNNTTISTLEVRVAPMGGLSHYFVDVLVPENQAMVLVIGGLLKTITSSTQTVEIAAWSDSGTSGVTLRSTNAWSNGLTICNQSVSWNPLTQILSPAASANGDSEFAFFDVAPVIGTNGKLRLSVPAGYASGTGDSLFIGLGTVVPEPNSLWVLALGAVFFLGRRTRALSSTHTC